MKFHSDGFRTEHKQRSTSGVEIGSRLDEEAAAEMEIEASGSQSLLRKVSAEWWTGEEYILSATAAGTKGEAARRSRPQDTVHNCRSVMELEDQDHCIKDDFEGMEMSTRMEVWNNSYL